MTGKTKAPWRIEIQHLFEKKLAKLPRPDRQQILAALEKLEHNPFPLAKSLEGRTDWRLRVGHWRLLLRVDRKMRVIIAYDLGPRGDVYRAVTAGVTPDPIPNSAVKPEKRDGTTRATAWQSRTPPVHRRGRLRHHNFIAANPPSQGGGFLISFVNFNGRD